MLTTSVELKIDHGQLRGVDTGVVEGEFEYLLVDHPALGRLKKLFDKSFYLYDHTADVLLTTYN
ncbi:hypothetical protein, partial [Acinetobacter baumannii]|uniref:hypothetical protein n=1 Tax=Acinetobacter baumannii TaxID=470 RepID=UPI003F93AA8D